MLHDGMQTNAGVVPLSVKEYLIKSKNTIPKKTPTTCLLHASMVLP